MKFFRQIALTALVTMGIFSTVVYTGCKDKCGSTTCQNSGTCVDNVCSCPSGYSGASCENTWTTEFLGTYTCSNEQCSSSVSGGTWESTVTVSSDNSGYTVTISNFAGSGVSVDATVDSASNLYITAVPGVSGISAKGNYSVNAANAPNGEIFMHYTVTSGSSVGSTGYECNMTMVKD